jgi:signal transduction histidine kinase
MVIVSDTGIGISEDNLKKLFRIDVHLSTIGTNDEIGTGLGLILCKELVEKNKGKIWVESEIGTGTDFYFTLPAADLS